MTGLSSTSQIRNHNTHTFLGQIIAQTGKMDMLSDLMAEFNQALRQIVNVILNTTKIGIEKVRDHQDSVFPPLSHDANQYL